MLTVYGLINCDTCRKARKWLEEKGIEHRFHDVRKDGLSAATVLRLLEAVGIDSLLNRRSSTWRELPEGERGRAEADAAGLIAEYPALMKRPVFASDTVVLCGFGDAQRKALKGQSD